MGARRPLIALFISVLSLVALLIGFGLPATAQQPDRLLSPAALERARMVADGSPGAGAGLSGQVSPQAASWTPLAVADDPLVRMPGTQPEQGVQMAGPKQCFNCHDNYGQPLAEPGSNWQGSMMAQAARDFLYWATLTVAAQDAIWAIGNPNATDICLRCHMPGGWLGGRSDPTNGSLMTGIDFDGVQCNLCHYLYDPFFETTSAGTREGNDWPGYWDETNASGTPSETAALATYLMDRDLAQALTLFNGQPFYSGQLPPAGYDENGSGQMFVSTLSNNRRASFADASATHSIDYSRYHKSKYFCSTCHDISNPVLHNLGADPNQPLPTETDPTYSYEHVERTFSEFMLSAYGLQGGSEGVGPYAPDVFDTAQPGNKIASCQDCHMRDVPGKAADKQQAILRPAGSVEHPKSGVPQHDLTGGNMWVSYVLASALTGSANYDATNRALLDQGANVLTLDLNAGDVFNAQYLLNGVDRARQMLEDAAAIEAVTYDPGSGTLSFRVSNQTGHKLISGYPEGRRMFLNIQFYNGATLLREINPYDPAAGTLQGLSGYTYTDPGSILSQPATLAPNQLYVDELVYELHNGSTITGEQESFHFVLSTHRYKDNRIPPKGFRIDEAAGRLSEPVWHGASAPGYFTAAEYVGGYNEVSLADYGVTVPGADRIEIGLYYQTTSREYIEFLRNEINGTGELTLTGAGAGGDPAYIIGTDPFFNKLRAWGDTIWQLWRHNKDVPGAAPVKMTGATYQGEVENQPPLAQADAYTTTVNSVLSVPAPGVLGNDEDADGDELAAVLESGPAHGALKLSADGGFVYTPNAGYTGHDGFTYRAYDGQAYSQAAAVSLAVEEAANQPPLAQADAYTTTMNTVLSVPAPGVLGNDEDADGDELAAVLESGPAHGALKLSADGGFVYTPTAGYTGQDGFSYRAYDGQAYSQAAAVSLAVEEARQPAAAGPGRCLHHHHEHGPERARAGGAGQR
jgi:hypothetical protein